MQGSESRGSRGKFTFFFCFCPMWIRALPVLLVLLEVVRALAVELMYASSTHRSAPISSSLLVLISEALKLLVSLAFVAATTGRIEWRYSPYFVGHSLLYFINNTLYYQAFTFSSSDSIHFLLHLKLPFIALLHHLWIRRQPLLLPWMDICLLFIGVLATQISDDLNLGNTITWVLCLIISANSGIASIFNEKLLKSLNMSFWEQQSCIYLLGVLFSLLSYASSTLQQQYSGSSSQKPPLAEWTASNTMYVVIIVIATTFTGLLTGALRKLFHENGVF